MAQSFCEPGQGPADAVLCPHPGCRAAQCQSQQPGHLPGTHKPTVYISMTYAVDTRAVKCCMPERH